MAEEESIKWGWSLDMDGEDEGRWRGSFDTKEEALADAREVEPQEAEYWVCRGVQCAPSRYVVGWAASDVIESIQEAAYEAAGDAAANSLTPTKEAEAELQELITTWADKHLKVDFWEADTRTRACVLNTPQDEGTRTMDCERRDDDAEIPK